jgi:hypothetical protein
MLLSQEGLQNEEDRGEERRLRVDKPGLVLSSPSWRAQSVDRWASGLQILHWFRANG